MRVLRIYHGGREAAHRARERASSAVGVDKHEGRGQVACAPHAAGAFGGAFPDHGAAGTRGGDINRHGYADEAELRRVIQVAAPSVVDVHEEPFSLAARQWHDARPADLPIVMYTAQNIDKRYPPPFASYERRTHPRAGALYPCSRQAASVARGKGFDGRLEVIPLGFDPKLFRPGDQSLDDDEMVLALSGDSSRRRAFMMRSRCWRRWGGCGRRNSS